MPARDLIAEYVRIESGRIIVPAREPTQDIGGSSDSLLRVESSDGLVSIIGTICIGELPGPVLGQICVQAGTSELSLRPLRIEVSLRRRSGDGYESLGE